MRAQRILIFEPCCLDVGNARLWRGPEATHLTRKAFAVLHYLVEHARQLVTKDELLEVVWSETHVSEAALAVCIREIRQALGDHPRTPRFIETVHGRGYRFLATVTVADRLPETHETALLRRLPPPSARVAPPFSRLRPGLLVGREAELVHVQQWLAQALRGERQVGFVTGETGIGKTTLVEAFIERVGGVGALWIGRGQCIEQYGAGEAYLPVLEALGRLCRGPEGQRFIALLGQYAPSWLVQMPALLGAADRDALQRRGLGATRERMLRELAEAVDILTAERPLVLVLEDLHWSDDATLAWLACVARRREPARLLVIGTYRPMDVLVRAHPVRTVVQELQRHGQCAELPLAYLTESGVAAYLAGRSAGRPLPEGLARLIQQRTDGNPLFMVRVVDALVRQGVLQEGAAGWTVPGGLAAVALALPESLRQLIEQQLGQLSPEDRRVVEAASVAGVEFSAAAVSAGVHSEGMDVEERCAALARREQFLQARGTVEWPDGTVAARYGFIHAVYQEGVYERMPAGRRVGLHQRIGARQEAGYGVQAWEIAAELAVHFERGRDTPRAVQYRWQAGRKALQRSAHQEAIAHLTKGLELLTTLPDTPERRLQELVMQASLGTPLIATKGWAAPEVATAYTRAQALWEQVGEPPQFCWVLYGLCAWQAMRAQWQTAQALMERLLTLAQRVPNPTLRMHAHLGLGGILYCLGAFAAVRAQVDQGLALYDPQTHNPYVSDAVQDPAAVGHCVAAGALWHLGYPEQARQRLDAALTRAQELAHPFTLAQVFYYATMFALVRREVQVAGARADALITLATAQEFPFQLAGGLLCRGRILIEQGRHEEGVRQIRQSLAAHRATGAEAGQPYALAFLARAYGQAGQSDKGQQVLDEALALVHHTGERCYEAELYRLKGELLLQGGKRHHTLADVEESFRQAVAVARRQQAKSLELRAALSLARLWQQQGQRAAAYELLAPVYDWFTEGFDTADLQEAKTLLEELGG
jgi:DNA-binding winged helix-turn-helix (wHTH) protein/predicted ATPase